MKCPRPSTNNYYVITFIIHHSIAVQIRLLDHIVHLLLRQFLPKVRHHVSQLLRRDQPVLVLVEHSGKRTSCFSFFFFTIPTNLLENFNEIPERLAQLVLPVGALHLFRHHLQELVELDGTVPILIHLVHHISQFRL